MGVTFPRALIYTPMSPLRALTATTGTAPPPPFLPLDGGTLPAAAGVRPPFDQVYQAPAQTIAKTSNQNHRQPEPPGFAVFAWGSACRTGCFAGGIRSSICPPVQFLFGRYSGFSAARRSARIRESSLTIKFLSLLYTEGGKRDAHGT